MELPIKKLSFFSLAITAILIFSIGAQSCKDGDVSVPSDLNLTITIQGADESNPLGDGSGRISCIATANNAVRFAYRFDGGELQESTDGTIEHTFLKQGTHTYPVLVLAYSSSGESINTTRSIKVIQSESTLDNLVFADEFDVDGPVDPANWFSETVPPNNGSWWNGEKQHYTDRIENAYVSDGTLKIVAQKEQFTFGGSTKEYTSARLNSKFTFTYGKIDVRAKLPKGVGTWPAIWTLGSNITSLGWPACGEIDIMEHWGHEPAKVSSAIHTVACSGVSGCPNVRIGERIVSDYDEAFHVYSAEWTTEAIKFYLDDQLLYAYRPQVKTADNWPFTQDQFILLNVAMGGEWFNIDPNFESSMMEIDYVRVYQ